MIEATLIQNKKDRVIGRAVILGDLTDYKKYKHRWLEENIISKKEQPNYQENTR